MELVYYTGKQPARVSGAGDIAKMRKKVARTFLKKLAHVTLRRMRPKVLVVAGSVGKSTTASAIASVMRRGFGVGQSPMHFNTTLGVPLSILGIPRTGGRSTRAWASILIEAAAKAYSVRKEDYPEWLVLEFGIDIPGNMKLLTDIVTPDYAVMTTIAVEHTERLEDLDTITKEEGGLIAALPEDGVGFLNADDPRVMSMRGRTTAKVRTFGFVAGAGVRAREIRFERAMQEWSNRFELHHDGAKTDIALHGATGKGNVSAAAAACAVGLELGLGAMDIAAGLAAYEPPKGRLRLIAGYRDTTILDDTYNAMPEATRLAVETLAGFPLEGAGRRFAVLGDMLELGQLAAAEHASIGRLVAERKVDRLLLRGELSRHVMNAAVGAGMRAEAVSQHDDHEDIVKTLKNEVRAGDLILVKGSQGMRMEQVSRGLLANPEQAGRLLVRQDWPK